RPPHPPSPPFPYTPLFRSHLDLVEHVTARGLPVHDDPANRDPRHLRSWVRTVLLPLVSARLGEGARADLARAGRADTSGSSTVRSEEHTSELQSLAYLVCR